MLDSLVERKKSNNPTESAMQFIETCKKMGWAWSAEGTIVRINKRFEKGDLDAYCNCDIDAPYILGMVPVTSPGSVWGTDGGSVGGYVGAQNGYYQLNVSGASKRFVAAVKKLS